MSGIVVEGGGERPQITGQRGEAYRNGEFWQTFFVAGVPVLPWPGGHAAPGETDVEPTHGMPWWRGPCLER